MDEIEKLMSVHCNVCPECGAELREVEISGSQVFIEEYQVEGVEKVTLWKVGAFTVERGVIIFECLACHRRYETYALADGDWTLSEGKVRT